MYTERLTENLCVVGTIDPVSQGATAVNSDIFSMALHRRALFALSIGANPTGVGVLIQENAAAAFTAGTATLLTLAGTAATVANTQFLFEVTASAMGAGAEFLRARVTPLGGAHLISLIAFADVERYGPGSDRSLGSVTIATT